LTRHITRLLLSITLLLIPTIFYAMPKPAPVQANIGVNGFFAADKAQKGRIVEAAIVMDIPQGYHVNSNRPLAKYSIPTVLKVQGNGGVRVSPVSYPRSNVRRFSFSEERLAVYEGKAVLRFNVTVPANFDSGTMELRTQLRFQSCNDEACFPPVSREITLHIAVVGANESIKRINGEFFGGGGGGRGRHKG
jgi:hypothetical protein